MPIYLPQSPVMLQQQRDPRSEIAKALIAQSLQPKNMNYGSKGTATLGILANALQGGVGAYALGQQRAEQQEAAKALAAALGGGTAGGAASGGDPYLPGGGASPTMTQQGANPYAGLIAKIAPHNPLMAMALALRGREFSVNQAAKEAAEKRAFENKLRYFRETLGDRMKLAQVGRISVSVGNVGPTGIDYGKPEKGLTWARNPDGTVKLDERGAPIAVPYQGGSVYREREAGKKAEAAAAEGRKRGADIVTTDVLRTLNIVKKAKIPVTGGGSYLSTIPGTAARDVKGLIDTIRANVGFDKLQQMRAASKTGGALGQVSEQENKLLQATLGNLEQSQSQEQFVYNLKRVYNVYQDIIHGSGNGPKRFKLTAPKGPGEGGEKPKGMTDDQWKRLQELRKQQGAQ